MTLLVSMDGVSLKLALVSNGCHLADVFKRLLQGIAEVVCKLGRLHPIQAVLEDGSSSVVTTFDGAHGSMQSSALLGGEVCSAVQNVVIVKDGLAGLEVHLQLTRHVVTLGVIDGNVAFFWGAYASVRGWDHKQAIVLVQSSVYNKQSAVCEKKEIV